MGVKLLEKLLIRLSHNITLKSACDRPPIVDCHPSCGSITTQEPFVGIQLYICFQTVLMVFKGGFYGF